MSLAAQQCMAKFTFNLFCYQNQAATRILVGTLTRTKNKKLAELELGCASSSIAHSCVTKLKFVHLSCYILTKEQKKKLTQKE
jgi:hypothetical protein